MNPWKVPEWIDLLSLLAKAEDAAQMGNSAAGLKTQSEAHAAWERAMRQCESFMVRSERRMRELGFVRGWRKAS